MNEITVVFDEFLKQCSREDLEFIVSNEVSNEEIITLLKKKEAEVKQNILENFGITIS